MYLLIPAHRGWSVVAFVFTFHNVSINSLSVLPAAGGSYVFTFHNVSINSRTVTSWTDVVNTFTFHNVSINSCTFDR